MKFVRDINPLALQPGQLFYFITETYKVESMRYLARCANAGNKNYHLLVNQSSEEPARKRISDLEQSYPTEGDAWRALAHELSSQATYITERILPTIGEPLTAGTGVIWRLRGIGYGSGLSMVDGEQVRGPDMSGFVSTKAEGEALVAMFFGRAFLDYRQFEPQWIQVKVVVHEHDLSWLEQLKQLVLENNNLVTPELIASLGLC